MCRKEVRGGTPRVTWYVEGTPREGGIPGSSCHLALKRENMSQCLHKHVLRYTYGCGRTPFIRVFPSPYVMSHDA